MTSGPGGPELALLDGRLSPAAEATIPVTDDGLLRGDGAFEVIRVYDGRPFALGSHLDRLASSAESLLLPLPASREQLEREVSELLGARGGEAFDGCLRIVATRGGRRLMLTEPVPTGPELARLAFVTYAPSRILDGVKSLSYAANMLASRVARERGFDEALLVTPHGRVLEAPTSSIFWVDGDGRLCTPPLAEHILASITRDRVMRLMETVECPVTADELRDRAVEAFLASTTREVMPVGAIEDHDLGGPGEVTLRARDLLRNRIEEELAAG